LGGPGTIAERTKRWFFVRATIMEAGGAGSSSNTAARSAARPACSDGFDNVDGSPECGVYIEMRGVEQVRIAAQLCQSPPLLQNG